MNIPSVPNERMVDQNGEITVNWRIFFTQFIGELQRNASNEGVLAPFQAQADIPILNDESRLGGLIYDTDAQATRTNLPVPRGTLGNTESSPEYSLVNSYHEMTEDEINSLTSGQRNGKFLYDSTNDVLKVGFNNQIKTVTTT